MMSIIQHPPGETRGPRRGALGMERRTPRLVLRPLRASDRGSFLEVQRVSREAFTAFSPLRPVGQTDDELFEALLHRTEEGMMQGTELRLASFLAGTDSQDGLPGETSTLIGFVSLTSIIRGAFHNAFVSWSTRSDRVGEGFASEAVAGLLDIAFESSGLGLHRVQANIMPRNVASIRVAERNGFRREGLAERYLCINGVWEDHVMFARTVEEHFGSAPRDGGRSSF